MSHEYAERRSNGTAWIGDLPANFPGANDSELAGVSCPLTSVCVAAGAHDPTSPSGGTLAELSV